MGLNLGSRGDTPHVRARGKGGGTHSSDTRSTGPEEPGSVNGRVQVETRKGDTAEVCLRERTLEKK